MHAREGGRGAGPALRALVPEPRVRPARLGGRRRRVTKQKKNEKFMQEVERRGLVSHDGVGCSSESVRRWRRDGDRASTGLRPRGVSAGRHALVSASRLTSFTSGAVTGKYGALPSPE